MYNENKILRRIRCIRRVLEAGGLQSKMNRALRDIELLKKQLPKPVYLAYNTETYNNNGPATKYIIDETSQIIYCDRNGKLTV